MTGLSPTRVRELLEAHDLRPSRALGQHFVADANTARRIVRLAGVDAGSRVLEIGPGVGSLTVALAAAGATVVALELDRHVVPVLEQVLAEQAGGGSVSVLVGDALTVDLDDVVPPGPRWHLVANLPYNVATPLVMRVLETAPQVERMLVMVQREVGERWAAGPGGKDYGAVSVKLAYFATARVVGAVPASVFVPPPKVESVLVELVRHGRPPVDVGSPELLFALVRAGFGQRRKMLRGALKQVLGGDTDAVLRSAGVDPRARAETLDLGAWAAVARAAEAARS